MVTNHLKQDIIMADGSGCLINIAEITNHGNIHLREKAVDILQHVLVATNPYYAAKRLVRLNGDFLSIDDLSLDLHNYEHIYILGAGKATGLIAKALEEILGNRISDGLVILRHGDQTKLSYTRIMFGAHPIPDIHGFEATRSMLEMARRFTKRDLVFAAITGGSSALMPQPVDGVTLQEKQLVNQLLLDCGADIREINAVRKHLSQIKGGWLAKAILPATLINLTVSDVIGNPLDYITDPTVEDTSTFEDARRVITHYDLWKDLPPSAAVYLKNSGDLEETPKSFSGEPIHSFILTDGEAACAGAAEKASALGFSPSILTTMVKGEAKDCGTMFAAIAREVAIHHRPIKPPCAIIAGGENTVTIQSTKGSGGPNQEFVLSASLDIAGFENILIAAIDTDGIDGSTLAAGGMVDGLTVKSAEKIGLDIPIALRDHNSYTILHILDDTIFTGFTGTNVNDLKLILVE
jgi:glycerate 2-kinase